VVGGGGCNGMPFIPGITEIYRLVFVRASESVKGLGTQTQIPSQSSRAQVRGARMHQTGLSGDVYLSLHLVPLIPCPFLYHFSAFISFPPVSRIHFQSPAHPHSPTTTEEYENHQQRRVIRTFSWKRLFLFIIFSLSATGRSCDPPSRHELLGFHISEEWTQNNWELRKRHSKRGKKMERVRGERDCQQSVSECIV
jgi:hypothetical protein